MKANKFFAIAVAALTFAACNTQTTTGEVESVSLDKTSVQLEVGGTATLVATVTPTGAGEVSWNSSNPAVASVDNGVVTGVAEGNAIIVATAGAKTASCVVTVGSSAGPSGNAFLKYLEGSDYFVFIMDDEAMGKIKGTVHDYRVNGGYDEATKLPAEGVTCTMDIWNGDVSDANFGSASGTTAFGTPTYEWLYWKSGSLAWGNICGGVRQWRECDFTAVNGDYTFVIIYKNPAMLSGTNVTVKFYSTKGGEDVHDKGMITQSKGDWEVAEWSMADLIADGLDWSQKVEGNGTNVVYTPAFVVEGAAREFEVCACFCYKK